MPQHDEERIQGDYCRILLIGLLYSTIEVLKSVMSLLLKEPLLLIVLRKLPNNPILCSPLLGTPLIIFIIVSYPKDVRQVYLEDGILAGLKVLNNVIT